MAPEEGNANTAGSFFDLKKHIMKSQVPAAMLLLMLAQLACGKHAVAPASLSIDNATVPATAPPSAQALHAGAGSLTFNDPASPHNPPVTVWYYNPDVREDSPVVFVMHGAGSSALQYRDGWAGYAAAEKFLLLAPEFSGPHASDTARYNLGGMMTEAGGRLDEACWTLTAIERIFDRVKAGTGLKTPGYCIYGHSAGAQFVHRLVLFKPGARIRKAIAANAGWYAMPDFRARFPYGLADSGVDREALRKSFSQKLVILLGEGDTDPGHPGLRNTPEAMAQGKNRLERGRRFFGAARDGAAAAAMPFNWELKIVSGAGHENDKMSREALSILLED